MQPKPAEEIIPPELVEVVDDSGSIQTKKLGLFERLLSPQSLNWMMGCGAGMLVIGFVVWLWSIDVFENPLVAAAALGAGNLGLLGLGVWLYKSTRYKLAGNGLTLLSSLVLPLNLWFYDAQGLIELSEGGPLWLPALGCCVIYAFIARMTRNPMFVYTLVGGIVLTGLLFLAGPQVGLLWALLPTATFLMVVGAIAIHADRWFQETEGSFSREQFGKAFYRAGHIVLMGGAAFLLGGQLIPFAHEFWNGVTGLENLYGNGLATWSDKIWATTLSSVAAYLYLYSHTTRPSRNRLVWLAGASVVWAGLTAFSLLEIPLTFSLLGVAAGIALVLVNIWIRFTANSEATDAAVTNQRSISLEVGLAASAIALIAISGTVVQLVTHASVFCGWMHILNLTVSGIACWSVFGVWQSEHQRAAKGFFVATGASALSVALVSMLSILVPSLSLAAILLVGLALPAITLSASLVFPISEGKNRMGIATGMSAITLTCMGTALALAGAIVVPTIVTIGFTSAVAAIFFFAALSKSNRSETIPGFMMMAITVAQGFAFFHITSPFAIIVTISCLGLVAHVISKVIAMTESPQANEKAIVVQSNSQLFHNGANSLVVAGACGTILFTLCELAAGGVFTHHIGLLAFQLLMVGLGFIVSKHEAWKQTMNLCGVGLLGMAVITFCSLGDLSVLRRVELGSLVTGLFAVAAAYVGWSREEEGSLRSEMVSFGFFAGTILIVLPMLAGFIDTRFLGGEQAGTFWHYFHEIGTLAAGLLLLGSGVLARVRTTTIGGATLCGMFVLGLIALIQFPGHLNSAAIMMMVGGGSFFAIAIVLSIYRDRILSMPERIRDGKGLFCVLKWR